MLRPLSLRLLRGLLLGVLLLVMSCSGRKAVYPVTGKVYFGTYPAKGAHVQFFPKDKENADANAIVPTAHVDDDGTFKVTTYAFGDGAPAGTYAVTVFWAVPSKGGDGFDQILVPERYLKPETSGLTAEIPEKATELPPFQLSP